MVLSRKQGRAKVQLKESYNRTIIAPSRKPPPASPLRSTLPGLLGLDLSERQNRRRSRRRKLGFVRTRAAPRLDRRIGRLRLFLDPASNRHRRGGERLRFPIACPPACLKEKITECRIR
ncbi:hypothetical protein HPP92_011565 [Vanilla planifolia]|uniref:Uncharacterized protein n=1 Tax=Vanilla planifolia TaxID=51239 RepID=A0A835R5Y7_VANPL|nr:hypothetical protein HPP92_011565 [Vanilla planifolia]